MLPSVAHILVVDDVDDFRTYVVAVLRRHCARVTAVSSAEEALAAIACERPDVVLSDLTMPGMDGFALARAVRALPDERSARIPMAALTAARGDGLAAETRAAGFDYCVSKPIAPSELAAVVARIAAAVSS